ncbi:DUF2306 domain-containing protein [Halobaculum marinum]|uniref:DUF2306 domain-containing protein n=1 Tax=Halobaculum marinum TaxID=3031996 RepID=A0ABD5X3A0_9EURY|nr:DUF2306 domain-containing protein [Halobaculum sp. DT55]
MAILEDAVLGVHIAAGFLALAAGAGALVTEKGGRRHRRLGRTYVGGMAVVSATALGLLALEQSVGRIVLGLIAVFSFYFAFSGYRVLSRKRPRDAPERIDWAAAGLLAAAGVGMIGLGATFVLDGVDFGVVLLVFGGLAFVFFVSDVRQFRATETPPRTWFFEHVKRMGGAYIATVTAFAVVNATFLPTVARWLVPTVVGTVAIRLATRRYQRQFASGGQPADAD